MAADGDRSPLYQQVERELLAAIAAGEYAPGRPSVTRRGTELVVLPVRVRTRQAAPGYLRTSRLER